VPLTVYSLELAEMANTDAPEDGDFASYLERQAKRKPQGPAPPEGHIPVTVEVEPQQTIEEVLGDDEQPTEEFLEEFRALNALPELSDEELARQALEDPGADGDVRTPE
jgi:hypothetical protein